jgi:hypothetical protein
MTDETLPHADAPVHDLASSMAEPEPRHTTTAGAWITGLLRWVLTAALILCVAALVWAVTLAGGGWHLVWATASLCLPLPLWYLLTDRRRGNLRDPSDEE